jgi:hypothetical protein
LAGVDAESACPTRLLESNASSFAVLTAMRIGVVAAAFCRVVQRRFQAKKWHRERCHFQDLH